MAFFRTGLFQKTAVFGLLGAATLLLGASSGAHPPDRSGPYSVTLEGEDGARLRTFRKDGQTFVLGYEGEHYEVRLDNYSDQRVEAVVSVDGRDAISGNVGDYVHARGYIIPPHGTIRVDGFRKSLDQTAAFRFAAPSSSYSARMGTPENVGVIGVAFFPERRVVRPRRVRTWPHPADDAWSWRDKDDYGRRGGGSSDLGTAGAEKRSAPSAPAASAEAAPTAKGSAQGASRSRRSADSYYGRDDEGPRESRLGTEYGESTYSPVTEVSFVRQNAASPAALFTLRYDDAEGLEARGFDVYPRPYWRDRWSWERPDEPEAFPENRFAPPPP